MTKIQIPRALALLKEYLWELDNLRTCHHDNKERWLWKNKVDVVLEAAFGKDSDEYIKLNPKIKIGSAGLSDAESQRYYLRDLDDYDTGIVEILQKYEILGTPKEPDTDSEKSMIKEKPKAFISHGKGEGALLKLERFLNELGVQPIIVKDQPNLDRTVDNKVEECLGEADFVIILATGDDKVGNILQPRQNVIHEIGLAQKTHPGKIIYLLEEGAEFPSNIRPKVYESFARQSMDRAFIAIARELTAFEILKAVKPSK